jgi:serine/threonine-protein kinase HipA
MDNKLAVWLGAQRLGTLAQDKTGHMTFTYDPSAGMALSLSMPLREEAYDHTVCESFFGGLLPESEHARQLIGKRFGVNGNNSFSLLSVIGHECAGAISIYPDNKEAPPEVPASEPLVLSENELASHIRELPRRPLLAGVAGIRLSLAGAGDKAAICLIDNKVALPADGTATSHILKPNIDSIGDTTANEFFCMRLASKLGLNTAEVEMRQADDISFLLVKRYDRNYDQTNVIRRIHQEDFCQALGVVSARKYQNEGGPGYKDCLDLLKKVSRPALDRNRMTAYIIFNFLIGNMDAHGKNFSLIHQPSLSLAPMYDLLSTRIYPELSSKLAMRVDKYYEADDIFPRHWQRLCESCGLAYPGFKRTFLDMCEKIPAEAEELRDELKVKYGTARFEPIISYINRSTKLATTRFQKESI